MPKNMSSKTHMKQKARYYKKHSAYDKRSRIRYTQIEEAMIINKDLSDVELAKLLKRSLAAIQLKRIKLREKKHG